MIVVSYDIKDDMLRDSFQKLLVKNGAIRLQYSVYEVNNTKRIMDLLLVKIETFSKKFSQKDSVVIFEVGQEHLKKYGNAVYRDKDIVFFD